MPSLYGGIRRRRRVRRGRGIGSWLGDKAEGLVRGYLGFGRRRRRVVRRPRRRIGGSFSSSVLYPAVRAINRGLSNPIARRVISAVGSVVKRLKGRGNPRIRRRARSSYGGMRLMAPRLSILGQRRIRRRRVGRGIGSWLGDQAERGIRGYLGFGRRRRRAGIRGLRMPANSRYAGGRRRRVSSYMV